jgi:SSS family solute:Na+ symporter
MTELQLASTVIIGLYFVLMLGVGVWLARRENTQGFIIGNRNVGTIPTMASLAASFRDGGGIAIWVTTGLTIGYGNIWVIFGVMVGLFFYMFYGPKLRKDAITNNYVTVGQVVRDRIGSWSEKASSLITLGFSLMLICLQFNVSGNMFANILHIEAWQGVGIVAVVLAFYLSMGGYKSVIITDTLQFFFILSLGLIPFMVMPDAVDVLNIGSVMNNTTSDIIALFLIGFVVILVLPDAYQRVFSARNDGVVKFSFPLCGLMLLYMTLTLIWLGMGLKANVPGIDPDTAYVTMFLRDDIINPWALGFIAMVVLAITMSTQSANAYNFVATLGKNFFGKYFEGRDTAFVLFSRVTMIVILAFTAALSLTIGNAMQFVFDAMSLAYILAPLYLLATIGKQTKSTFLDRGLACTTILAAAFYVWMFTTGWFEKELMYTHAPVFVSITLALVVLLIAKIRGKA